VIEVSLTTTTVVAASPPKVTEVAPVKPVPVMVTAVAVSGRPEVGATLETTGAANSSGASITGLVAFGLETVADVGLTMVQTMAGMAVADTAATMVATMAAADTAAADTAAVVVSVMVP
jgi:hypothetical protein